MENDPQSALGYLNRGIDAFDDGNLELARRHFAQALLQEPDNELAWLWLAEASEVAGEKRYCFDRAVGLNPDSAAFRRREELRATNVAPVVPPVIRDLASPQLPPSLKATAPTNTLRRKLPVRKQRATSSYSPLRNPRLWFSLSALVILLLGGAWILFFRETIEHHETVYFAVVGPMTGESAAIGEEIRNAALLARDAINCDTAHSPKVELLFFDDQNDPTLAAQVAQQIVDNDRIVGVVGHGTSSASLAAAPIYAKAKMPVVSGQATIDSLADYKTFFRTIFSNRDEARIVAHYLYNDLDQQRVSIVTGTSDYEQSLAADFDTAFANSGTIANVWTITDDRDSSIAAIIEEMKQAKDMGALFLAVTEANGYELILQLRSAGLDPLIVGSEALGTQGFPRLFADQPLESEEPGFFTNNMYAVSPLLYDSVGGATLAFAETYQQEYDRVPDWRAPKIWDAVSALAKAAERGKVGGGSSSTAERRATIVDELANMTDPSSGFPGLAGPMFFTEDGRSPQGLSIGTFQNGRLTSAPLQYRMIDNSSSYDIEAEVKAGSVIQLDGYDVRRYRVAYVGVEMIQLSELSSSDQSYKAEFYLYFRYNGDDEPLNIVFTNAADSNLGLGDPLTSSVTKSGMTYKLFRVQGTFNEPMDFSDYPWDEHELTIRFQNPDLTQNDIVYVADPSVIQMTQEERLRSGFDLSRPFNQVPSWNIESVQFQQVPIASTAEDYDTDGIVYYSEFRVAMDTKRDVNAFLEKNMLPLILLTLVTYIAIWFPAEQAGARIGFAITALLSSSVMLNAISSQLPEIGYTVSIEWGYYAYIGLSAVLVLLTIAVDRAFKTKRRGRVRRLDTFIRVVYPITIGAVIALYLIVYRSGNRTAGGQDDIRAGVSIILGCLLLLSAAVVFFPDHFHLRSLRGSHDPDLSSDTESVAEPA